MERDVYEVKKMPRKVHEGLNNIAMYYSQYMVPQRSYVADKSYSSFI